MAEQAVTNVGTVNRMVVNNITNVNNSKNVFNTITNNYFSSPGEADHSFVHLRTPYSHFVGRESNHNELEKHFFSGEWAVQSPTKVALIHGMAGIGKTEFALTFANTHRSSFSFIHTIPAETEEGRAAAYRDLAQSLHLPLADNEPPEGVRKKVFRRLENIQLDKPYLLFFDNVEEKIPLPARNGHLILTSRDGSVGSDDADLLSVELRPLTEEEGIALLKKRTGEEESPEMKELVKQLCGHPLALAHAAAYIAANPLRTIAKYLSSSKNMGLQEVLDSSLNALGKECPEALAWLRVCACLSPDAIPLSFLEREVEAEELREQIAAAVVDQGLIRFESGVFSIHRLVQEGVGTSDKGDEAFKRAVTLVSETTLGFDTANYQAVQAEAALWAPHANHLLTSGRELSDESCMKLLSKLGRYERSILCRYKEALAHLQRALELCKKVHGEKSAKTGDALMQVGQSHMSLAQYEEARTCFEGALEIHKAASEQPGEGVLRASSSLGNTLKELGKFEEALKVRKEALEVAQTIYGEEHIEVADALHGLAHAFEALGMPAEALKAHGQGMQMREKLGGEEDPAVADSLIWYAMSLLELSRPKESLVHLERAQALLKKAYGNHHPKMITVLTQLGWTYNYLDEYKKCAEFLEEALKWSIIIHGEEHLETATILLGSAAALVGLDRYEEGLERCKAARAAFVQGLGEHHPKVFQTDGLSGSCCRILSRPKEAHSHYEKALAGAREIFGEKHPKVAEALMDLAAVEITLNRHEEALKHCEEARSIYEEMEGKVHFALADCLIQIGEIKRDKGKAPENLEMCERALGIVLKGTKRADPNVATYLIRLGDALNALKRYDEALEKQQEALELIRKTYGPDSGKASRGMQSVGSTLAKLRRHKEAIQPLSDALEVQERISGKESPTVLSIHEELASSYEALKQYEKALVHRQASVEIHKKWVGEEHAYVAPACDKVVLVLHSLGRHEEALPHAQLSLKIWKKQKDLGKIAASCRMLGTMYYWLKQYAEALKHYRWVLQTDEKLYGAESPDLHTDYFNVGLAHLQLGNRPFARARFAKAIELGKQVLPPESPSLQKYREQLKKSESCLVM